MSKQRIGILGGTFDPIHAGHLQMASAVLSGGHVDKVLVVPTGNPPYKSCDSSPEDRWKMVVAACSGNAQLIPSRLEIDRSGPVYSIDTIREFRKQYPKAELFYIIGSDALLKLRKWHCFEDVLKACAFLVCPRKGAVDPLSFSKEAEYLTSLGARFVFVHMEPVTVSSTEIRAEASGRLANLFLDVSTREYINAKGLYRQERHIQDADVWIEKLFRDLNPHRFAHSLSVAFTARRLARIHGIDPDQAEEAGLLHDCAKCLPLKEMQRIAREHSLTDDPSLLESGALLHSTVGAWVARNEYGMADPEVLEAIAYHNTGHAGMSRLAMCVCLADSIEPRRDSYPLLERVRLLAELSLERALLLSLEGTSDYVRAKGKPLHPRTLDTIAWLKELPAVRAPSRSAAASADSKTK